MRVLGIQVDEGVAAQHVGVGHGVKAAAEACTSAPSVQPAHCVSPEGAVVLGAAGQLLAGVEVTRALHIKRAGAIAWSQCGARLRRSRPCIRRGPCWHSSQTWRHKALPRRTKSGHAPGCETPPPRSCCCPGHSASPVRRCARFRGSDEATPYWLKRWYSVGARKAVPTDAVARHCGVMA